MGLFLYILAGVIVLLAVFRLGQRAASIFGWGRRSGTSDSGDSGGGSGASLSFKEAALYGPAWLLYLLLAFIIFVVLLRGCALPALGLADDDPEIERTGNDEDEVEAPLFPPFDREAETQWLLAGPKSQEWATIPMATYFEPDLRTALQVGPKYLNFNLALMEGGTFGYSFPEECDGLRYIVAIGANGLRWEPSSYSILDRKEHEGLVHPAAHAMFGVAKKNSSYVSISSPFSIYLWSKLPEDKPVARVATSKVLETGEAPHQWGELPHDRYWRLYVRFADPETGVTLPDANMQHPLSGPGSTPLMPGFLLVGERDGDEFQEFIPMGSGKKEISSGNPLFRSEVPLTLFLIKPNIDSPVLAEVIVRSEPLPVD